MPIIFAQSLMLFPSVVLAKLHNWFPHTSAIGWLHNEFGRGGFLYLMFEAAMIYFFAYFWTTVQFQPKEMANQLRDYGSFIPGLRLGKRTADANDWARFVNPDVDSEGHHNEEAK